MSLRKCKTVCPLPSCHPTELQSLFHSSKLPLSFHSSPFHPSFQEVTVGHVCVDAWVSELAWDFAFPRLERQVFDVPPTLRGPTFSGFGTKLDWPKLAKPGRPKVDWPKSVSAFHCLPPIAWWCKPPSFFGSCYSPLSFLVVLSLEWCITLVGAAFSVLLVGAAFRPPPWCCSPFFWLKFKVNVAELRCEDDQSTIVCVIVGKWCGTDLRLRSRKDIPSSSIVCFFPTHAKILS